MSILPKISCPYCDSTRFQRRGFGYNLVGRYQRYQCLKCYRWFSFPEKQPELETLYQQEPLYSGKTIVLE